MQDVLPGKSPFLPAAGDVHPTQVPLSKMPTAPEPITPVVAMKRRTQALSVDKGGDDGGSIASDDPLSEDGKRRLHRGSPAGIQTVSN